MNYRSILNRIHEWSEDAKVVERNVEYLVLIAEEMERAIRTGNKETGRRALKAFESWKGDRNGRE